MSSQAIKFENNESRILDQLRSPHESVYVDIKSTADAHNAIRSMSVRGAPAIAIVGMLGVAVDSSAYSGPEDILKYAADQLDFVVTARPTAVNLGNAADRMRKEVLSTATTENSRDKFLEAAQAMLADDIKDNLAIGQHGMEWCRKHILDGADSKFGVITICNTGSLATAGYGTASGIVRSSHESDSLERVYPLETRPYNQGARSTAYELVHDKIPSTLITDSMAASLMKTKGSNIKLAVVGADRVAANGDTANKIGTYQLAVLAKYHGIKVVVAAPTTSIDLDTPTGNDIKIEERPSKELTHINGQRIAADGIDVWNPSFDVTPYHSIDAIITEKGVWIPGQKV